MTDKKNSDIYLTGRILLAMPGLSDTRFHKAVIFMCAHDENGAMGLVINHTLPGLELGELMKQLNVAPLPESGSVKTEEKVTETLPEKPAEKDGGAHCPVLSGGPVETARGFILHSNEFNQSDTIKIDGSFSVTGTVDALKAIASGNGPDKMLFILGYAGWGAGQLDREIQQNSWLVADADPELVFGAGAEEKWERAIRNLGINPAMLSGDAGHA